MVLDEVIGLNDVSVSERLADTKLARHSLLVLFLGLVSVSLFKRLDRNHFSAAVYC